MSTNHWQSPTSWDQFSVVDSPLTPLPGETSPFPLALYPTQLQAGAESLGPLQFARKALGGQASSRRHERPPGRIQRFKIKAKAEPGSGTTVVTSPHENRSLFSTHTEDGWVSDLFEKARPDLLALATEESTSSAQPVPVSEQIPGKNTSVEKPGSWRQGRQD